MDNRPKVGVSIIVRKNSKVFIGKRKNIIGSGNWGFPGGHLENGEELNDCVKREVMEETRIKIKNIKFVTLTNDIFQPMQNMLRQNFNPFKENGL